MRYTLYMDHDIDRQQSISHWTMDLLCNLVARFPEVEGAQFIRTFNSVELYMPRDVCCDTAKVLKSQELGSVIETSEEVGLGHCDPSELCELVWEIAEFFEDAGTEYGIVIS